MKLTDRTDEHQFYFFRFLKEILLYYGGNMSKNARSALETITEMKTGLA